MIADPHEQRDEAECLAETLKRFLRAEAERLVAEAKGAPVLCSYSNDGTPLMARKRSVTQGVAGQLSREGGESVELLCQRAIFRARDSTGRRKQLP